MQTQASSQTEKNEQPFSGLPLIIQTDSAKLSMDKFKPVFVSRRKLLESIKELVSIKFYQGLENRLKAEEEAAEELTNSNYLDSKRRSRYSNVLDAQYFEQRFL